MNSLTHYATCAVWETGSWNNCTCYSLPVWRIRKEPSEQFPWRIWRRTTDMTFEPLMRASTFQGALALVKQLTWLRHHALTRESNV